MEDKKGYGIVIPNDWDTKKIEKLSLEDFHEELMRLDKEAFYRMANEVELDLPLLENAGYEYHGLSTIALVELDNFARSSDTLRKYVRYIIEVNPASYEMRADFDYVLALYDREHNLFDKYYPEDMARIYSQEVADVATTENSQTIKLIRLFIDEFKDDKTEWRYKVLENYGARFQSCFAFEYFVSKRGLSEWYYKSNDEYGDRDLEQAERLKELMNLYRLLKDGSDLIVQSSLFKSRKAMISANAAKILGDLIIMGVPFSNKSIDRGTAKVKLHEWYQKVSACTLREVKAARDAIKYKEEEVLNYFINRSTNAHAESLNSKLKGFRAQLRGVQDLPFFMFRASMIFG